MPIQYPEGWASSTDAQKEQWAGEADLMLNGGRAVPRDSLQSFAVVWQYKLRKAAERRNSVGAVEHNDDEPKEEVRDESAG